VNSNGEDGDDVDEETANITSVRRHSSSDHCVHVYTWHVIHVCLTHEYNDVSSKNRKHVRQIHNFEHSLFESR